MPDAIPEFVPVPRWLILGSFPGTAVENPSLADGIPGEAALSPAPGQVTAGRAWQEVVANPVDFCDAQFGLTPTTWCFAYAFTYLHVAEKEKVEICCGSDDGIAVWLNGECVHFNNTARGVEIDNDVIPVQLRKGWNRLLVKISQGGGTWGFTLRLRRPSPTGPLRFTLQRRQGAARQSAPLSLNIATPRFTAQATLEGLALHWPVQLFNDAHYQLADVSLTLEDDTGYAYSHLQSDAIPGYAALQPVLSLPAATLFPVLAAGAPLHLHARSRFGEACCPLPAASAVTIFLAALRGFTLPALTGTFPVPAAFRGQPALLQVRSQYEMSTIGQAIARHPLGAGKYFFESETATGMLVLDVAIPEEIADPYITLEFGDDASRLLVRQVTLFIEELGVDTASATGPAQRGVAALAQNNTAGAWQALREVLATLAATLPDYSRHHLTLVGHAHIDMNWMWTTPETEQITHDTFRQVLAFMDEFPQFTFSQSQSAAYQMIEEIDPAMFTRIRARVAEGRWELLGGMVDEGDTNLASGEGIARSLLLGQRYFRKHFNKTATIGWLPDNFGHAAQLPQLLRLAGIEGFFGHRCMPMPSPFRWQAPDGSFVMSYALGNYTGQVLPAVRDIAAETNPQHGKAYLVYGVGDHGGGPTRRDIVNGHLLQTLPGFPQVEFGSASGFFASLRPDADVYPIVQGELQYVFPGCYTSIALIKEMNRRCENTLYSAELLAALLAPLGFAYPAAMLRDAWHAVAFNQFHDILCGSGNGPSNREAIGVYDRALALAERARDSALRALCAQLPTAERRGQPIIVVNPLPQLRSDVVEADIFTYEMPASVTINQWSESGPPDAGKSPQFIIRDMGQGPFPTIRLCSASGEELDAQIVGARHFPQGFRLRVRFIARDVPPCGWQLYYADPRHSPAPLQQTLSVRGTTIDTPHLTVKVDEKTGHVTRIYDKTRGVEVLPRGSAAGVLKIVLERPHEMSAWLIGEISAVHLLDTPEEVTIIEQGPVRAVIQASYRWGQSLFLQRVIVYHDLPRVEFETEVHWFERGGPRVDAPMLRVVFPLRVRNGRFTCDTPCAAVTRPNDGREVPAQRWVDLSNEEGGVTLLNDGKYGFSCAGNVLEMALLRASYMPDPYPDQGKHLIRYALAPHAGDWITGGAEHAGQAFNIPLLAQETPTGQPERLSETGSLLTLHPSSCQLSGVKQAEDDASLIIRFCEMHGTDTTATITFPRTLLHAVRVNLLEDPYPDAPAPVITAHTLTIPVRAHEIVTLKVGLQE